MDKTTFQRLASERLMQSHEKKLWCELPEVFVNFALDDVRAYDFSPPVDYRDDPMTFTLRAIQTAFERQQVDLAALGTAPQISCELGKTPRVLLPNVLISPVWLTGGSVEGNSWRSKSKNQVEPEPEPEFLEDFLEEVYPEIAYLQLRAFRNRSVRVTCHRHELYEGVYEYAFKMLSLPAHMLGVFRD
jgi:hypothetical protein